jgi:Ribosomal protein S5, N-terminal domain
MSDDITPINPETSDTPETPMESAEVSVENTEISVEESSTPMEESSSDDSAETVEQVEEIVEAPAPTAAPATRVKSHIGRSHGAGEEKSNNRGGDRRDDRRGGGKGGFEQVKKEFEEVLLEVGRVTKVTSGGRQLRFRAAVVIGDRKGRVGFGLGKAQEVTVAVEKAVNSAKRHMIKVPLENGTVPYQVATKFKSVKIRSILLLKVLVLLLVDLPVVFSSSLDVKIFSQRDMEVAMLSQQLMLPCRPSVCMLHAKKKLLNF